MCVDYYCFIDWNGECVSDIGVSVNGMLFYEFVEGYEVFVGVLYIWLGYCVSEYVLLYVWIVDFYILLDYEFLKV